jgi:hypothetical protein
MNIGRARWVSGGLAAALPTSTGKEAASRFVTRLVVLAQNRGKQERMGFLLAGREWAPTIVGSVQQPIVVAQYT